MWSPRTFTAIVTLLMFLEVWRFGLRCESICELQEVLLWVFVARYRALRIFVRYEGDLEAKLCIIFKSCLIVVGFTRFR